MNEYSASEHKAEELIETARYRPEKLITSASASISKWKSLQDSLLELYLEESRHQPVHKNLLCTSKLLQKLVKRDGLNTLVLSLYPDEQGYSIGVRQDTSSEPQHTIRLPYEESEFLEDVDREQLPSMLVDLLDRLQCNVFYNGCVICEVCDYRRSTSLTPTVHYVLLSPTQHSLQTDMDTLACDGHRWTQEDRNTLESTLLLATSEPLCLDPSPTAFLVANKVEAEKHAFNTPAIRRNAGRWSQRAVSRKRAMAAGTSAPSGLRLHQFLADRKDKARSIPPVNLKVAKTVVDSWRQRDVPLAMPSHIDVEKYARPLERHKPTIDSTPMIVEEYTFETGRSQGKVNFSRLTVLQRMSDESYVGRLYVDRDYVEGQSEGSTCQFPLGTRADVIKYINQFREIFTEEGRRQVKITHCVPGHNPSVSFTHAPPHQASSSNQAPSNQQTTPQQQKTPTQYPPQPQLQQQPAVATPQVTIQAAPQATFTAQGQPGVTPQHATVQIQGQGQVNPGQQAAAQTLTNQIVQGQPTQINLNQGLGGQITLTQQGLQSQGQLAQGQFVQGHVAQGQPTSAHALLQAAGLGGATLTGQLSLPGSGGEGAKRLPIKLSLSINPQVSIATSLQQQQPPGGSNAAQVAAATRQVRQVTLTSRSNSAPGTPNPAAYTSGALASVTSALTSIPTLTLTSSGGPSLQLSQPAAAAFLKQHQQPSISGQTANQAAAAAATPLSHALTFSTTTQQHTASQSLAPPQSLTLSQAAPASQSFSQTLLHHSASQSATPPPNITITKATAIPLLRRPSSDAVARGATMTTISSSSAVPSSGDPSGIASQILASISSASTIGQSRHVNNAPVQSSVPQNINIQHVKGLQGVNITNLQALQNLQVTVSGQNIAVPLPIAMLSNAGQHNIQPRNQPGNLAVKQNVNPTAIQNVNQLTGQTINQNVNQFTVQHGNPQIVHSIDQNSSPGLHQNLQSLGQNINHQYVAQANARNIGQSLGNPINVSHGTTQLNIGGRNLASNVNINLGNMNIVGMNQNQNEAQNVSIVGRQQPPHGVQNVNIAGRIATNVTHNVNQSVNTGGFTLHNTASQHSGSSSGSALQDELLGGESVMTSHAQQPASSQQPMPGSSSGTTGMLGQSGMLSLPIGVAGNITQFMAGVGLKGTQGIRPGTPFLLSQVPGQQPPIQILTPSGGYGQLASPAGRAGNQLTSPAGRTGNQITSPPGRVGNQTTTPIKHHPESPASTGLLSPPGSVPQSPLRTSPFSPARQGSLSQPVTSQQFLQLAPQASMTHLTIQGGSATPTKLKKKATMSPRH